MSQYYLSDRDRGRLREGLSSIDRILAEDVARRRRPPGLACAWAAATAETSPGQWSASQVVPQPDGTFAALAEGFTWDAARPLHLLGPPPLAGDLLSAWVQGTPSGEFLWFAQAIQGTHIRDGKAGDTNPSRRKMVRVRATPAGPVEEILLELAPCPT